MEQLSFSQLSTPRGEFLEPTPSTLPLEQPSSFEFLPDLISLVLWVRKWKPYSHLSDFERLCSLFVNPNMTQDTLMWKLFPYSLIGKAEQWYMNNVGSVSGSWGELRDNFCLRFFPTFRVITLHRDICHFRQKEKESIGKAWFRFSCLV